MRRSRAELTQTSDWRVAAALRTELLFAPRRRVALGIGSRAGAALASRLASLPTCSVLLIGFCGGLRASLGVGDLVLANQVFGAEGDVAPAPEAVARAATLLPHAHVGSLVTMPHVASPEEKARLGLAAVAVDMESAPVARELAERGVPFLVLRVVLDALWEEVPRGLGGMKWSARALTCARRLGQAATLLASALPCAAAEVAQPRRPCAGRRGR